MKFYFFVLSFCLFPLFHFAQNFQVLDINANDIVYAKDENKIYFIGSALSSYSDGFYEDSLCILNPNNGIVEQCYHVGNNPMVMAISHDYQYIYIGLRGTPAVTRFNRDTEEFDQYFILGTGFLGGNLYAEDIEVFPYDPESIAVAKRSFYFGSGRGVAIYKNELELPLTVPHSYPNRSITFASSNSVLYGYNKNQGAFDYGLNKMTITQNGIELDSIYVDVLVDTNDKLKYSAGALYSHRGYAVDLTAGHPTILGKYEYDISSSISKSAVAIEESTDRIFFAIKDYPDPSYVHVFKKSTFELLNTIELPVPANGDFFTTEILKLGVEGEVAVLAKSRLPNSDQTYSGANIVLVKDVSLPTSNHLENEISSKVFPNPTSDIIHVQLPSSFKNTASTFRLFNSIGVQLNEWKVNIDGLSTPLSLKDYPDGIYFLQSIGSNNNLLIINKIIKKGN